MLKSFPERDYGMSVMYDIHISLSPVYTINLQFTHSIKQFIRWREIP